MDNQRWASALQLAFVIVVLFYLPHYVLAQTSGRDGSNASQQIVELHAHTLLKKVDVYINTYIHVYMHNSHHSSQHVNTSLYHLV